MTTVLPKRGARHLPKARGSWEKTIRHDGYPLTKPSLGSRWRKRRARGKAARLARRRNRGAVR